MMEIVRLNKTYHLTIKPSHIMLALVVQALAIGQLAIFSCKWALNDAAKANVTNRAMLDQANQKAEELQKAVLHRYGIIQVER
jgi:hypothetical protein